MAILRRRQPRTGPLTAGRFTTGLAVFLVLFIGGSAQAQPLVTVSCSSVFIDFRTSIQPDSSTVQIDSNAGTETHSVTLVQGGTDVVTFPLDGQSGEIVTVTVTLVYKGNPNVTSATQTLADCPSPSPSPSPSVQASPEPSPICCASPTEEAGATPGASPSPEIEEPVADEVIEPLVIRRSTGAGELPRTGLPAGTLAIVGMDLVLAGFLLRRKALNKAFRGADGDTD